MVNETKDEDVLKRAMFEREVVYLCLKDFIKLLRLGQAGISEA